MEFMLILLRFYIHMLSMLERNIVFYEGWNFNSGNYLFTTDTK